MAMTREQFTKIVAALHSEGYGVIRLASFIEGVQAAPVAPKAAESKTVDGRSAYKCSECGQPGHNARHHAKPATPAAPAPKASAPKAPPAVVPPSMDLGDLSFDLGDLGGAPVPPAPKAAAPKAPKASAPAPAPEPAPEASEATDEDLGGFLDDLDGLLP